MRVSDMAGAFFGYNNLCAITYSSGIGFVCELLDRFEQAEIIFGCEDVMDYSMQSVMAYQCKLIERMRNKAVSYTHLTLPTKLEV